MGLPFHSLSQLAYHRKSDALLSLSFLHPSLSSPLFRHPLTLRPSLGSTKLVIIGGLAELFSGAISMGLGAYLAAVTERDHYICEEQRERDEVATKPEDEKDEIYEIMDGYGVDREATRPLVDRLERNPEQWVRVCLFFWQPIDKRLRLMRGVGSL
jgi:hypothetical protein